VTAEAGVDDQLLLVIRLRELEEKDLGREIVDVGESQSHQALLELVCNDLWATVRRMVPSGRLNIALTLTSKEENLCFILIYTSQGKGYTSHRGSKISTSSSQQPSIVG
jgi:hypothetical protein